MKFEMSGEIFLERSCMVSSSLLGFLISNYFLIKTTPGVVRSRAARCF